MTVVLYCLICSAVLTFLAASFVRAVTYARTPLHLRWELYPVPHEERIRVKHGGSYFEVSEWWTAPRHFALAEELRFMVPEMLFLRGLRQANRSLWYRSFPFHFGLYLLACSAAVILAAALGAVLGLAGSSGPIRAALPRIAAAIGSAGLVLAVGGAVALLHRRLTDPALRSYTAPGDIFNLLFFIAALGLTGVGYLLRPSGSPGAVATITGLLSWNTSLEVAAPFAAGLIASAALVAYIPLTHMSHFVAKYFTYHAVRWDDAPLLQDQRMAARLAEHLAYRPTWSAAHLGADGSRTWADVASSNPAEAEAKR